MACRPRPWICRRHRRLGEDDGDVVRPARGSPVAHFVGLRGRMTHSHHEEARRHPSPRYLLLRAADTLEKGSFIPPAWAARRFERRGSASARGRDTTGRPSAMNDVTHILSAIERGDPQAAEQLLTFDRPMGLAVDARRLIDRHPRPDLVAAQRPGHRPASTSSRPGAMTPAICRAPATSRGTSASTRWPGPATSCGWSIPASPACARRTPTTASCRPGGRRSSPPWPPRTAAI